MIAPAWFQRLVNTLASITFALMSLACIGTLVHGLLVSESSEIAFGLIAASILGFLSWLYGKGPLSRIQE
jgi:hypothetical protein